MNKVLSGFDLIGSPYQASNTQLIAETPDQLLRVYESDTAPPTYDVVVDGILKQHRLEPEAAIRYLVHINRTNALQAKLDQVMLEHCPEEMTEEQKRRWGEHQKPVAFGCHCDIETQDEGFVPDACVMDEHMDHDCIYAPGLRSAGKTKHECSYWRPIQLSAEMAKKLKVD